MLSNVISRLLNMARQHAAAMSRLLEGDACPARCRGTGKIVSIVTGGPKAFVRRGLGEVYDRGLPGEALADEIEPAGRPPTTSCDVIRAAGSSSPSRARSSAPGPSTRAPASWFSDGSKELFGLDDNFIPDARALQQRSIPTIGRSWRRLIMTASPRSRWRSNIGWSARRHALDLRARRRRPDEAGEPSAVNGIHLDITDRKQAEQELEETRQQFELAVEGAKLGIWTIDPKTGETWYRARSRELYGVDGELHLDAKLLKAYIHPDDWDMAVDAVAQGLSVRRDLARASGRLAERRHALGPFARHRRSATRRRGAPCSTESISTSPTASMAEQELARSRDALHQSEKLAALGSLLAGVSHELNNPLAAIVGQAEMLQEDSSRHGVRDRARRRSAPPPSAARGSSRPSSPWPARSDAQRGLVDLNDARRLVARDRRIWPAHRRHRGPGRLSARCLPKIARRPRPAPPGAGQPDRQRPARDAERRGVREDADRPHLGQPERRRSCSTSPTPARAFPTKLTRPDLRALLHHQAAGHAAPAVGLSFSHGIVEAHGGTITLEPSRRGAHFRIALPPAAESDLRRRVPIDAETGAAASGRRPQALIVEDEADVAETLRELLEREGYRGRRSPPTAPRRCWRSTATITTSSSRTCGCRAERPRAPRPARRDQAASGRADGLRHRRHAGLQHGRFPSQIAAGRCSRSRSPRSGCAVSIASIVQPKVEA